MKSWPLVVGLLMDRAQNESDAGRSVTLLLEAATLLETELADAAGATALLRTARKRQPGNGDVVERLVRALSSRGQIEAALTEASGALGAPSASEMEPARRLALSVMLAELEGGRGNHRVAVAALRSVLDLGPDVVVGAPGAGARGLADGGRGVRRGRRAAGRDAGAGRPRPQAWRHRERAPVDRRAARARRAGFRDPAARRRAGRGGRGRRRGRRRDLQPDAAGRGRRADRRREAPGRFGGAGGPHRRRDGGRRADGRGQPRTARAGGVAHGPLRAARRAHQARGAALRHRGSHDGAGRALRADAPRGRARARGGRPRAGDAGRDRLERGARAPSRRRGDGAAGVGRVRPRGRPRRGGQRAQAVRGGAQGDALGRARRAVRAAWRTSPGWRGMRRES